jgi:hypothetical protein
VARRATAPPAQKEKCRAQYILALMLSMLAGNNAHHTEGRGTMRDTWT